MSNIIDTVISNGTAYGKAIKIDVNVSSLNREPLSPEIEEKIFEKAIEKSIADLEKLKNDELYNDNDFISVHQMLISDPQLKKEVIDLIYSEKLTSAQAFVKATDKYISDFKNARTTYLKERVLDMEDIKIRVLSAFDSEDEKIDFPFIAVVDELYPSILMKYKDNLLGVIAKRGGFTSHSAIICKSREIPYVLAQIDAINEYVMIDTRRKIIITNPTDKDIIDYKRESEYQKDEFQISKFNDELIKEYLNVTNNNEIEKCLKYNMDGVGLYRTELIFMNLDRPMSYDEQYQIYNNAVEMLKEKTICFRTFDIGDDKQLSYIKTYKKGILNYKNNKDLFEVQIKALINANHYGNMKIMFPMIETHEEFIYLKDWVNKIKVELGNDKKLEIGMMLETKEALNHIETFNDVDFISIGTNDLTSELYHIKREEVLNYSGFIKDLLKLIKKVVNHAKDNNITLSICGELASIKEVVKMLYKIGMKNFSVSAASVRNLDKALTEVDKK